MIRVSCRNYDITLATRIAHEPQVCLAGVRGSDFPPDCEALLFLRLGRFLGAVGAGAAASVAVLESALWAGPGPKPKNAPGNLRGFDSFDEGCV